MKSNRQGRWIGAMVMALLLAGGKAMGQASAPPADPCEAPIPPEMGADYDDNCWAYTPNASGAMFTELWEKSVEVDCPVLNWKTGSVAPVVDCAKVGTDKTKSASRPGEPDLKAGTIHCLFEADGYDCGNHDETCEIDPKTIATTWKIETGYQVKPISGTGQDAQFTVTVPEDALGPIEFDVEFKVKGDGCYPALLAAKGCDLESDAGKVPVTIHPVRLIIETKPENPWAGDIVTYSLGKESIIPPNMEVQWSAPNSFFECGSDATKPPSSQGGQFRFDRHVDCSESVIAEVCSVKQSQQISARVANCLAYYYQWEEYWYSLQSLRSTIFDALMEYRLHLKAIYYLKAGVAIEMAPELYGCGASSGQSELTSISDDPQTQGVAGLILLWFLKLTLPPPTSPPSNIDPIKEKIAQLKQKADEIRDGAIGYLTYYANGQMILNAEAKKFTECVGSVKYGALTLETADHWAVTVPQDPKWCSSAQAKLPKTDDLVYGECDLYLGEPLE